VPSRRRDLVRHRVENIANGRIPDLGDQRFGLSLLSVPGRRRRGCGGGCVGSAPDATRCLVGEAGEGSARHPGFYVGAAVKNATLA
jgi:hypothetical protein